MKGDVPYTPTPLTDKQRKQVRDFYAKNPDGGYRLALQAAGRYETRAVAKAIILGDEDLADVPFIALKIDEGSALKAIGQILSDTDHKDRLRAATFALGALHGISEKQVVDVTAAVKVDTEDRSASLAELAAVLKRSGALDDS